MGDAVGSSGGSPVAIALVVAVMVAVSAAFATAAHAENASSPAPRSLQLRPRAQAQHNPGWSQLLPTPQNFGSLDNTDRGLSKASA
jgi:hypothetical protein